MNELGNNLSTRRAATNGLAVAGFIALVIAGMWLAVYSTRFVPTVVNSIGSATVYLGSVFIPAHGPILSVVPTASTTIPFGEASSTISTNASSTINKIPKTDSVIHWTPSAPGTITGGNISSPATPTYYGLPDLSITIEDIGYSTTDGIIVSTTTIPAHTRGAVKFLVTNIGTNISGPWTVTVTVAGNTYTQTYTQNEDVLLPTQPRGIIAYFVGVAPGKDRPVVITVNPLPGENTTNNAATTNITILGN